MFPVAKWETDLVQELDELPRRQVAKAPPDQIEYMKMLVNKCHENVDWYVRNDPSKEAKTCNGWLLIDDNYVLHSVVEVSGQLVCITPTPAVAEMIFVPDKKLDEKYTDDSFCLVRNGREISPGVRRNPQAVLDFFGPELEKLAIDFGLHTQ